MSSGKPSPCSPAGRSGWTTFGARGHSGAAQPPGIRRSGQRCRCARDAAAANVKPQRVEANGRVQLIYDVGRLEAVESTMTRHSARTLAGFPQVSYSTGASWQVMAAEYAKIVDERAQHGRGAVAGRWADRGEDDGCGEGSGAARLPGSQRAVYGYRVWRGSDRPA